MGRNNRILRAIFSNMFRGGKKSYIDFLSVDEDMGIKVYDYKPYKLLYQKKYDKIEVELIILSKLEEIIIQKRCLSTIEDSFKLFYVDKYLYGRSVFYRSDKEIKDIRVIISRSDELPTLDLPTLSSNSEFMKMSITKLKLVMETEIEKNVSIFRQLSRKNAISHEQE